MAKTLKAIQRPAAIEVWYRKQLLTLVKSMRKSVEYWVEAKYKQQESRIVNDASPGQTLWDELDAMFKRNSAKFTEMSDQIAKEFGNRTQKHVQRNLLAQLSAAGFAITPKVPRAVASTVRALVLENVSLINSIPQQYLASVAQAVQRGVLEGRNYARVMDAIRKTGEVTERRALMITRDQVNKGAQALALENSRALGIERGIWQHHAGGKTVRDEHVAFNGQSFNINEGLYDEKEGMLVMPGELINCNCTWKPELPEAISW